MTIEKIELRKPISFDGGREELCELEFREPTVGDLLKADAYESNSYGEELALLAALTGQPEALLKRMSVEDFGRCRTVLLPVSLMVEQGISYETAKKIVAEAQSFVAEAAGQTGNDEAEPPGERESSPAGEDERKPL